MDNARVLLLEMAKDYLNHSQLEEATDKQYGKTADDSALRYPERQAGIVAQKRGMNNTATALQRCQRSNRQH